MNLTREELEEVVAELAAEACGSVVQEVRQPSGTAVCLGVRRPGRSLLLLFETAPRLARMHLTDRRCDTLTPIPGFCAKLRKELLGTFLAAIEMPWPDRVVACSFSSRRGVVDPGRLPVCGGDAVPTAVFVTDAGGEAGGLEDVTLLVFEGSGHHSNLFLTDASWRILAMLRPSSSHVRDLRPGRVYVPPAQNAGGSGEGSGTNMTNRTDRTSRTRRLGREEAPNAKDLPEPCLQFLAPSDVSGVSDVLSSSDVSDPAPSDGPAGRSGPSARIDQRYSGEADRLAGEADRVRVESQLCAQRKKVEKTLARLAEDEAKAIGTERFRLLGDLLKINLRLVKRGMDRVVVPNVYSEAGEDVEIPLDVSLGPRENMEKLFSRYRKGARGIPKIRARREEMLRRLGEIEQRLCRVDEVPPPRPPAAPPPRGAAAVPLTDLTQRLRPPPLGEVRWGDLAPSPSPSKGPRARTASGRLPYRRFESGTGRPILVGREGKDNHALTFQVASPHDVWLHVRGFPGCHVVVPLARGQEPDTETLLDAAHLAVHFSKAPKKGFVEVMWTRRKQVRALKGGRPGQVLVEGEKTLGFHSDAARVERLLAHRPSD